MSYFKELPIMPASMRVWRKPQKPV